MGCWFWWELDFLPLLVWRGCWALMPKCKHRWEPDGKREKCSLCNTKFPCPLACQHVDCCLEKGQALPEWIVLSDENEEKKDD